MNTRPPIILRQRRDFGQTIGDTFAFMRQNWKPILKAIFTICVLPLVIALGFLGASLYTTFSTMNEQMQAISQGGTFEPTTPLLSIAIMLVVYPLFIFIGVMMEAITHEYIGAYEKGEHIGITAGQLWRRSIGQFWHYFGILLLNGLAIVVGFVLCILPGIWIATSFIIAPMARAAERASVTDALGRSFTLVHKNWWWTLLVIIVLYFIIGAIQGIVFLPFYLAAIVSVVSSASDGFRDGIPMVAMVVGGIGYLLLIIVSFLTMPLFRIGTGLWYYSLVEQTESKGLQERVAGLDTL
jgi:hypothetical protein